MHTCNIYNCGTNPTYMHIAYCIQASNRRGIPGSRIPLLKFFQLVVVCFDMANTQHGRPSGHGQIMASEAEEERPSGFWQIMGSDEESHVRVTLRAALTGDSRGEKMFYLHSTVEGPRLGDILSWARELSGAPEVDVLFVPRPGADSVSCAIRPVDTLRAYIEEILCTQRRHKARRKVRRRLCFTLDAELVLRANTQTRLRLMFHHCTVGGDFAKALRRARHVHANAHDDLVSVQSTLPSSTLVVGLSP